MSEFRIHSISKLQADFRVPGDKSMSHRSAILAGLADGVSEVENFLPSEDCVNTLNAMRALGAEVTIREELPGYGPVSMSIRGRAMKLAAATAPIDCGNAGTGMRLLAGMLAAQPFTTELFGDESLSSRPMGRIMKPLAAMGAKIEAMGAKENCAPLRIHGTPALTPITYEMPVASAQVKSAILLAGLFTPGTTTVVQPAPTRDHTERMFADFGIRCVTEGNTISLEGGQMPRACQFQVPGDISSAAFWLVAAAALPGAKLTLRGVGMNPTRDAIVTVLQRMGAKIEISLYPTEGEPIGDLTVHGGELHGTELLPEEIPNLIDEIPVLSIAASLATGKTSIRNAHELRVKETDRIATVVKNLRLMGGEVEEFEDGMEIQGGVTLRGAKVESYGDHRIAMAFAIAGLFAGGETVVGNVACVNTSYPGFGQQLQAVLDGKTDPAAFALQTKKIS